MPLYEYACRDCGERFEVLQRLGEGGERLTCPRCGAPRPERRVSTFAACSAASGASDRGACGGGSGFT
ncbi:MAG TPA: zinc ribbon domain-containing protein [Thermoanaerobaculia bacterium]|nr:zinc ribbon domain-containing protein [Thermoanaerobaculia bacterium]